MATAARDIIVFDALCILCSANAQFVLRRDRVRRFDLASMQGPVGTEIYAKAGIHPANPDSLVVVTGNRILRDSDAVLHIYRHLGQPWRIFAAAAAIVPSAVRDPLYRLVARNRYRWFGKRETCWVAEPADRHRLL